MTITENHIKTYTDRAYKHTEMVRYKGKVIALAMDDQRRIYYSVLDLDSADEQTSPLDVNYWLSNPKELDFPSELAQVGYGIIDSTPMPIVKKGSRAEAERGTLQPEEIDPFLSSTARLTSDSPFQALSDGKYIYIFRQSINLTHSDIVFKRYADGSPVTDSDDNKVPVVNDTLLVDRFILAGTDLLPKREVRYKRSRNKYRAKSTKDSLGAQDMEKKPFFEPTHELDFVRNLQGGRFSVLLLPTQIAGIQRWQIFTHNSQTGLIDSFNVERFKDGLFNTKGTQFYTSPNPDYQNSVFERQPGTCPFTGQDLIPIVTKSGYAESCLVFDGQSTYVTMGASLLSNQKTFTIEGWVKAKNLDKDRISLFGQNDVVEFGLKSNQLSIWTRSGGSLACDYPSDGQWHHVAVIADGTNLSLCIDGQQVVTGGNSVDHYGTSPEPFIIGAGVFDGGSKGAFDGEIDEIRLWTRARSQDEIKADLNYRLEGNEPGLAGYWQFDEGAGNTLHDRTDNANHGQIQGNPQWVKSEAPIGDRLAMSRMSFKLHGRTIASGISAILYHQQEKAATGYDQQEKPLKKNARVMLAIGTGDDQNTEGKNYIGVLDFAVSREGKLGQVPDNISLPILSSDDLETASSNETLDRISDGENQIQTLQGEIKQLENDIKQVNQRIPAIDPELTQITSRIQSLQQEIGKTSNLRYKVSVYTGDASGGGTDANVYVTLKGSLRDSREFEIDSSGNNFEKGAWDYFGPFELGEIGALQRVRIRHDNAGISPGWYLGKVVIDIYQGEAHLEKLEFRCMLWLADHYRDRTLSANDNSKLRDRVQIQKDIDQNDHQKNTLQNEKSTLIARKNEYEGSKGSKQNELGDKQKELTVMKAKQGQAVPFPMSFVHVDPLGLTTSGGLLGFAYTKDTPQLFESATGKLALYFRGVDDQFFATYYDTNTKKAQSLLPADTGNITLTARNAEPEQDQTSISVSDGTSPDYCTVVIQNTATDITETWNSVPREVEQFANVFNGNASEKVFIGSLVKDVFGIVTALTLEKPVQRVLNPGETLLVGQTKVQVDSTVRLDGATEIPIISATIEADLNTSVYFLSYDYQLQASANKPNYSLQNGSLQFFVFPGDAKGNVQNGTASSNGTTVSCQWVPQSPGKALAFDGQDDYVGIQDSYTDFSPSSDFSPSVASALQLNGSGDYVEIQDYKGVTGTNARTVEAWIKTNHVNGAIVSWGDNKLSQKWTFRVHDDDDKLRVEVSGGYIIGSTPLSDNQWHHVACTWSNDGSPNVQDVQLYVDGRLETISSRLPYAINTSVGRNVFIGNDYYDRYFEGTIDEVRIWDRVRTQQEIQADLNQRSKGDESGLVGYWRFENGIAKDYSANGHDGTYHRNPKLVEGAPLTIGNSSVSDNHPSLPALQFTGNDYINCGDLVNLQNQSFTVECWAKRGSISGAHQFIMCQGSLSDNHGLHVGFRNNNTFTLAFYGNDLSTPSTYTDTEWHHWSCTYSSATKKRNIYCDGKLVASNTATGHYQGTGDLYIGQRFDATSGLNGELCEVRVWNYERTQTEIQADMDRPLQGSESGLVGYWRFNTDIAKDYSGNGNDGTYYGNPQIVASSPVKLPNVSAEEEIVFDPQLFPNLAKSDADGDLTLEVWVNPSAVTDTTRVIHHHSPNSKYTLGLKPQGDGYSCFMGIGSQFKQTQSQLQLNQWQHLSVAYNQSYALDFKGSAYLSCEHNPTLDISQDLTIEVFLQVKDFHQPVGILSKGQLGDGTEQSVPYSLYIDTDGKIAFAFEDKDGSSHVYKSSSSLSPGEFYKIAVTRAAQTETKNEGTQENPNVKVNQWADIRFYIDQQEQGYFAYEGKDPGGSNQPLEIGKVYRGSDEDLYQGILSEIRLYNTALKPENLGTKIQGNEQGLISWWRFEENEGNVAYDSKSTNHAVIKGAKWVKTPDPKGSTLFFYQNGSPIELEHMTEVAWGEAQFTLGGNHNGGLQECFGGTMEEVRIWKVARTQEQVQDNLFGRLKGEKDALIANYTFDSERDAELQDHSLLGNHLPLGKGNNEPTMVLSTAPISDDIAQVRSALGGVKTYFHDVIHCCPAVQEYGDLQYDADGNLMGVHKRCYGYIKDGQWMLLTGYKVGDLVTEWIGQVQANPQIIGYIEGAPPVPSENLTSTSLKLGEFEDYNGASAVELEEADSINYIYSASAESGFDTAIELLVGVGIDTEATAGLGFTTKVADVNSYGGVKTTVEYSNSQLSESSVSYGRNTTKTSRLELRGAWEQAGSEINHAVGRRFLPSNLGFALVQSDTMDVFALRLTHNNALVSYRMQPNPDIPKDWNIITFPLNNTYSKQGTLDGKVGVKEDGSVQCDPHYPNATTYGQYSYFKPIEAYSLKKQIERERQELEAYYQQYSSAAGAAQELVASDVPRQMAARNLVNTYVWTADGGFFSESTEVMESVQESNTSSYSFQGMGGFAGELNASIMGVATHWELDALFGGHVETVKTKEKETERSFNLAVEVDGDNDLQLYVNTDAEREKYHGRINEGGAAYDENGNPVLRPGKVDAYRFMSFYLEPTKDNFEDFFNKVVDPIWLDQSNQPNAVALRQANQGDKKPKCWRIMHRVTFVSRILPEITADNAPPVAKAMKSAHLESNYELIKKLEPFVKNKTHDYITFADGVRDTLKTYLPELQPHETEIIEYAALYFGVVSN